MKPNQLGILTRPFDYNNAYRLCVSGVVLFPFEEPRFPMTESALWVLIGKELGEMVLDESMPKEHGEILMRANAYAPGGQPRAVVRVAVELGGRLMKEVAVVGDRVWKSSVPTEPQPFAVQQIGWDNAFGGIGFKNNPLGKGYQPKEGSPLPNIEDPKRLIASMRQAPDPVGFGPYDLTWPQRLEKAGTYDKKWLDELYPGLARNIDWSFFNVAPPDQQITGFFRGDEEIVLHNLHPSIPRLVCKLPEVQLRCFMRRARQSGGEAQTELEMRLDTVWLFPHAAHGVLVFHGIAPIREDDASDVTLLCLGCEDLGEAKPLEHYNAVIERRLSTEHGAVAALDDLPLLPRLRGEMKQPPTPADEMAEHVALEHLSYRNLTKKGQRQVEAARELLVRHGLDPDEHGPAPMQVIQPPSSIQETVAQVEKMEQELLQQQRVMEETLEKRQRELKRICDEAGLDFDEMQKEWMGPFKGGPPEPTAEKDLARLRKLADDSRAAGFDPREIDDYLADPAFVEMIRDQDSVRLEAYRLGAQDRDEPDLLGADESRKLRQEILAAHARGESLANRDLTGADLSGIELPGANLEEALMERCNFARANLTGANLKRAVLVRADLSGARLDRSNLEGVNLSKAKCAGTSFVDCPLVNALLMATQFVSATLDGVTLDRATLYEAKLDRCSLRRIRAESITLDKLDLKGTSFAQAVLVHATFMNCVLDAVDFTEANLQAATLLGCQASRAVFAKIDGRSLRVVEGTDLSECDFREANLEGANLRGAKLVGANFTDARAAMADFSEANMQAACLYHLIAPQSRFIRTDLTGANMAGANLFEALMSKAIVCGANLNGANLYQADMAIVRGDENTQLEDTIAVRARLKPLHATKVQDLD